MAERKIKYSRGVHKRSTSEGIDVYMYVDTPGVFYNAFEIEVSDELARDAGYNVDLYRRMKQANEKRAAFEQALAAEMEGGGEAKIVQEREGFQLLDLGEGKFQIKDPEGALVNKQGPLSGDVAAKVFNKVVPERARPQ